MTAKRAIFAALALIPLMAVVFGILSFSGTLDDETTFDLLQSTIGHPVGTLVLIGALVLYLVDVWRNVRVPREKKWLWTVVFLIANVYAMPFYYWFYIR